MILPEIPVAAVAAAVNTSGTKRKLEAAWPHLYAAALRDLADRMDRASEIAGKTEGPEGWNFVVACARTLAEDAEDVR